MTCRQRALPDARDYPRRIERAFSGGSEGGGLYFDRIELVGSYDIGIIGENVYCWKDWQRLKPKQGAAAGLRFKLSVKRKVTMILYMMEGMALADDRPEVFYLSYTIY